MHPQTRRSRDPWDVEIGRTLSKSLACFSAANQPVQARPPSAPAVVIAHRPGTRQAIIDLDKDRAAHLHLSGPSPRYRLASAVDLIRRY